MLNKKVLTLVTATVLSVSALPALADSVSFGFSVGDHGGHHGGWDHGYGHGGWGHGWDHGGYYREHWYRPHYFAPYPYYYAPRPVVYYNEPEVIEQRVIVDEPISATRGRVVSNDPYCREYQRSVTVGGRLEHSYGTACRQPDGEWKIVNEND